MKKFLLLISIIIVGLVYVLIKPSPSIPKGIIAQTKLSTSPLPTVPKIIPSLSIPTKLIIPKIHVNARIESVGMDSEGNMDVPKDSDNAAWYNLGYKPGESGSAVIDGHFDKASGAPAVFYELSSLAKGDEIKIEQSDGKVLTFRVTDTEAYQFDKLPLQKIFNTPGNPTLTLITCEGTFNKSEKNYSQRLVIYAALME